MKDDGYSLNLYLFAFPYCVYPVCMYVYLSICISCVSCMSCMSCTGMSRLRRAYVRESLKLHSIDWEFRRSIAALGVWKRQARCTRQQLTSLACAERFWRHARLGRVMALLRSRCGQDTVTSSSPSPPSSSSSSSSSLSSSSERRVALWRSGLGAVETTQHQQVAVARSQPQGGQRSRQQQQHHQPCILFYSLINRSHGVVADHQWERHRLVSHVCALSAYAAASSRSRMQVHRATWFWKYWREAMALQRYDKLKYLMICIQIYTKKMSFEYC